MQYSRDAAITTEILKYVPTMLRPLIALLLERNSLTLSSIIGNLTMHWSGAERTLFRRMIPVTQNRLRDVNNDCEKLVSHQVYL